MAAIAGAPQPASAQDWGDGRGAVIKKGAGLKSYITSFIQQQGWRRSRMKSTAKRTKPNPSMRDTVPQSEFFRSDKVTSRDNTQCWEGVF